MRKKLLLATVIFGIFFFSLTSQKQISDKEYAAQVLGQYIRYYCPRDGDCTREQALARTKKDWADIYDLGFFLLEENE